MPKYKNTPQNLTDFLELYTVPELKKLAGLIASHLPTRKADVIKVIKAYLLNPSDLRQLWLQLDSTQQAAVAEVVHAASNIFDADQFRAKYGQNPHWGNLSGYTFYREKPQPPSQLWLFFYRKTMPRDLKALLKTFVPPPRTVRIKTIADLPTGILQTEYQFDQSTHKRIETTVETPFVRLETERAAQHDLKAVLHLIDAGKVRASDKTKRVTAAAAKAITKILQGGDFYPANETLDDYFNTPVGPMKAFAWPLILQSAGLAELAGTKLQLTPAGRRALNAPLHKTIERTWKRWLKTKILDEFNRVDTIKGQSGRGKRKLTAVAPRRAAIAEALAECPPNEWIQFNEFSRYIQAAGHIFDVAHNLWELYISDSNYGSLGYEGFGEWHIVQARYMLAFLFEYAATMGLLDIAYIPPINARPDYGELWGVDDLQCLSRYDGLIYFRLNNLGAWCLGLTETYVTTPIEEAQILQVLPNMDIVATGPLPPADALFLEQIAEQTSDAVWKLDREKLLKTAETGQKVADIETFLKAKSGSNLPDTITLFFKETAERLSSLLDRGDARLIEAKDEALAQLIANDSKLRSLCMVAGNHYIVVPRDNEAAFRRTLRKLGYGLSA